MKPVRSTWIADGVSRQVASETSAFEHSGALPLKRIVEIIEMFNVVAAALPADTWAEEPAQAPAARTYEDGYRAALEWVANECDGQAEAMMERNYSQGGVNPPTVNGVCNALSNMATHLRAQVAKGGGT